MCSHLYVCVASINNLRQGCRPVSKRWHSQRERGSCRRAKQGQHVHTGGGWQRISVANIREVVKCCLMSSDVS